MPLPPALSPDERSAALAKAAAARRQRAELKEKLKMGSTTLKELLEQAERDEVIGKMKVVTVLESLPGVGKVRARRMMEQIGISRGPAGAAAWAPSSASRCSRRSRADCLIGR